MSLLEVDTERKICCWNARVDVMVMMAKVAISVVQLKRLSDMDGDDAILL